MGAPKRERRAAKNLPPAEWLTAYFASDKNGVGDTFFDGPVGCDRHYLYASLYARRRDEHGGLTLPSFIEELEARGYDVSTLEFRIRRKPTGE